MKKATAVGLLLFTSLAWAKDAPTVSSCQADIDLWFSQVPDFSSADWRAREASFPLSARTLPTEIRKALINLKASELHDRVYLLNDCVQAHLESLSHTNRILALQELYNDETGARVDDFILRHNDDYFLQHLSEFYDEDSQGKR